MGEQFTLDRVEVTSDSVDVRDLDELDEREITCLWQLASGESATEIESKTATRLSEYGVIKYTEFVEVSKQESNPNTGVF